MSIFQKNDSFIKTFSPAYFSSDVSRPLMLERLTNLDIIVIDAAIISGLPGERARRLVENRYHVAPHDLPKLLITVHSDSEKLCAQRAIDGFKPFVASIEVRFENGRNETAVNALKLHQEYWPDRSMQERKNRILLLGRRGGGGKPQFIVPFTGGAGTTCGTWTPISLFRASPP